MSRRYRPSLAVPLALGTVLLAVLGVVVALVTGGPAPVPPPKLGPPKTPADRAARAMPPGEVGFIAAIAHGKSRAERAAEICKIMPNPHFFAWSGVVASVTPTDLSIEIAPALQLATEGGPIDPHVLPASASLQPGQAVAFSGIFQPGAADCYRQAVEAPEAAMAAPVFGIRLYGIAPIGH